MITLLWLTSSPGDVAFLIRLALCLLFLTIVFLLIYGYIVSIQTYEIEVVTSDSTVPSNVERKKVIGGFKLTEHAQNTISKKKLTVQKFFQGTGYDPDAVWTRSSRALAKQAFAIGYMGLISSGTIALAVVAILMSYRV